MGNIKTAFLMLVLIAACIPNVHGLTIDDLVGIYIGHLTTTYPDRVERVKEITTIEADGLVTNYVMFDWFPEGYAWVSRGYLDLNEDGSFPAGEGSGFLTLHGRHLDVRVHFPASLNAPETTVHFQGHRTSKAIDLPLPWLSGAAE
jgi:hypothetical protein